ncbi:unnamed protein product [Rotaria sordida]|uniref:Uncharacterized protein n=1 Tax=Rotaria sordida TaxID=392033 RepID=A0A813TET4_9BILA|nr:unnamed protein product [Rotaria sordida]
MANSSSSYVISEPTGPFHSDHEANLSYRSIFNTSLEHNLPNQIDPIPPSSSSIFIDAPVLPSNETPSDFLHGFSAPTLPVYINMNISEKTNNVDFAGPITTTDPPLSPSYVDYPLSSTTVQRHSHHYLPHHSQNQNRYPYVHYYERRSTFRRPRTPNAPSMPEHLSPGYIQDRTATSRNENSRDYNENNKEEDQRPSKSFWVILRLVFFVLVIEFIEAVETALTIPILTSLHVDESFYSMAWLISPILGFFFQPVFGMWSDTCKCRWGRRRPFILAFAIGAYIGIVLLLNSSDLGAVFGDSTVSGKIPIRAVVLTAAGVTLIDFCADSANAPIRAYLIDTTNPSDQERGFNIHAILGFGGGLGFIVGTIKWTHISMFKKDGGEFSVIFYIATFLFIVCTISTLTSIREEPLIASSSSRNNDDTKNSNDDDEQPEIEVDEKRPLLSPRRNSSRSYNSSNKPIRSTENEYFSDLNKQEGFVEIDPATGERIPHDHVVERPCENVLLTTFQSPHQVAAVRTSNSDPFNSTAMQTQEFDTELQKKAKLVKLGFMRRPTSQDSDEYDDNDRVTIKSMIISMVRIPARLWKLMICQVIGWIGYFATHLYFTDFMATEVYNGTMEHGSDDLAVSNYKLGVKMGCWGLLVFSASSAVYAFCLERWLANRFSLKTLYFIGYLIYVLGCTVNFFFHQVAVNIVMCFTFGILVVSLNTLPYQMLSQFHADKTYRNRDGSKRGIGIDCALLNSCHFLGELIVAVSLGPLLAEIGVNYCMIIAAGFTLIGNVCMFFLFYFKN